MAPVVRITDTDVMPVADSDDSIDELARLPPELILDGSVVLPLDGKIEDSAMEGRELGETGDTSAEELEPTAQQLQDRLEERFLDVPTPYTESRTDGEINTSQVTFTPSLRRRKYINTRRKARRKTNFINDCKTIFGLKIY